MKNAFKKYSGQLVLLFLVFLLTIVSCIPQPPGMPTEQAVSATGLAPLYTSTFVTDTQTLPASTASPTFTRTSTEPVSTQQPEPSVTAVPEEEKLTSYTLLVSLDYDAHWLEVVEEINYVNHSPDSLSEILLLVEPNRYSGVFLLNAFSLPAFISEEIQYELEGRKLLIHLPQPLSPGENLVLKFSYELFLPFKQGIFGYSARQTNLADWYIMVPPYDPQSGWQVFEPAAVGEHLIYELADFRVEIQLVSNGTWPVIAAPVLSEQSGSTFRYQKNAARNFTWSASPDYQVLPAYAQNTLVLGYIFNEHTAAGQDAVEYIRQALEAYNVMFGYYPLECMTIIESDFPDGMEYDGLFFLNQSYFTYYSGDPSSGLCALSAHETAHQWWYRVVSTNQALEPWMDEALCTYSELLFYEYYFPELVDWWWRYRVEDFNPGGWVDSTIYTTSEYRPYVNAVYLQGVRFLDALRTEIGKEALVNVLNQYAAQFQYGYAGSSDLLKLLNPSAEILQKYFSSPPQ